MVCIKSEPPLFKISIAPVLKANAVTWQQAYVNISDEHAEGSPTYPRQYYYSIGLENTSVWQQTLKPPGV